MDKLSVRPALRLIDETATFTSDLGWHDYSKAFARNYGRDNDRLEHGKDTALRTSYTFKKESQCAKAVLDHLISKTQLRAKYRDHALAIFTSIILADTQSDTGQVSFSRRPASYSRPKDYPIPLMRYQATMQAIEALVESGLAYEVRGSRWPEGRGKRSTLRVTFLGARIIYSKDWVRDLESTESQEPDLVIVKDRKTKRCIEPPCRSTYERYVARLDAVNRELKSTEITIPEHFITSKCDAGHIMFVRNPEKPECSPVIVSPNVRRRLRMPFLNDFEHGGRPVGWDGQILPRAVRRHCLLDGEPVSELDFQGSHIAIAYCLAGLDSPDFDPYYATARALRVPRHIVKRAALCALNCNSIYQAEDALKSYMLTFPEFALQHDDHTSVVAFAREILIHLKNVHNVIAGFLFSDFGIRAQASEARIMLQILEGAQSRGFNAVPLHDGILCPRSKVSEVRKMMNEAWWAEFGQKPPKVEKKQEETRDIEDERRKNIPPICGTFFKYIAGT